MQNRLIIRKASLITLSLLFIIQITAGVLLPIDLSPNTFQIQTNKAYAADSTWEGDVSTDWNTAGNWSLGAVPDSTTNVTIPDAATTTNDPAVSSGANVGNVIIQTDGILNGNANTINVYGDWTNSGTFNHGSGTVVFTGGDDSAFTPSTSVYNNIEVNMIGNSYDDLIISGTATVLGNLTHTDGELGDGQINLAGNYIVGANAAGAPYGTVATIINFNHASNDQTIAYSTGGIAAHIMINKAGGTFSITDTIFLNSWTYITGTVTGLDTYTLTLQDDNFNGVFAPGSFTYTNIEVNMIGSTYDNLTISSGTLDINGNLTLTDGELKLNTNNPDINLAGNLSIASAVTYNKGTGTLTFDGSTASTFTDSSASPQDIGSVVINKTGESLTLLSDTLITTLAVSGTSTLILGADLTVSGNTAINNGATLTYTQGTAADLTVDGTLTVYSGGTILTPYTSLTVPDSGGSGRTITAGNIDIQSGGTINADELGFGGNAGPGRSSTYADGGSYGGRGGDYGASGTIGSTYGSMVNPISLGSGGWHPSYKAGGAIIISTTGTITVNGILSASGTNVVSGGGIGSGGSINITASVLDGSGTIRANGGNSSSPFGSGGGGRISLNSVTTDSFLGSLQANGGSTGVRGNAGTIYFNSTKRANLVLGGSGNLTSLRLGTDDTATAYTFGTIIIQSGGTLEIDGNPSLNSNNGGASTLNITTLDIQSGGILSADSLGFTLKAGPGTSTSTTDGGSYGGRGGDYLSDDTIGVTYGSITNPTFLGSGGERGGGGGAIIISATNVVTINGMLNANGSDSSFGRGSGGTINITTSTLAGSGTIRVNGGSGSSRGSGSGGRISITQTVGTTWTPTFQAFGGSTSDKAAAGTIYLKDANDAAGDGELIIDNNNVSTASGTDTDISSLVTDTAVGNVIIRNSGKLQMDTGTTLTVSGTWTNTAGESLSAGTVTFDSTSSKNITSNSKSFYNLTLNGSGGTWTPQDALDINNNLTITTGTLASNN